MAAAFGYVLAQLQRWSLRCPEELSLAGRSALILLVALAASAAPALVNRGPRAEFPEDQTPPASAAESIDRGNPPVRPDRHGDPLPPGAIARLGTVRFRHADRITFVAFTPDSKRLVSRGDDGVRLWDAVTGKELRHFAADGWGYIPWGDFSTDLAPDGKRVAVAAHQPEGAIEFWDVDSGKKTGSLGAKLRPLVRFSPDGKFLVTSSAPSDIELWDVAEQKKLRSWKVSPMAVSFVAFSADSRRLLTTSAETDEIRLWDAVTGRLLQEFEPPDRNHRGYYRAIPPMALSADGNLLALREWTDRFETAPGKVEWKTRLNLRDAATGKIVRRLTCPSAENGVGGIPGFHALTFTPDGKRLITGGPDRFIRMWDVKTGEELRRFALESGQARSLTLSPDGKKLAVVVNEGGNTIRVLDLTSGKTDAATDGHYGPIVQAALSPDGQTAVTSGPDGVKYGTFGPLNYVYVWDAATGRVRRRLDGKGIPFLWMQLDRGGHTLFSLSSYKTMSVWDVASGQEQRRIELPSQSRHYVSPDRVALTPDGKTLAVIEAAQTIHILDAANGSKRQRFRCSNNILGMKLTPDCRLLTMWSYDRKIRIWDVRAGRCLHEYALPQAGNRGYTASVSPDGRLLAAMGVWSPLPPEQPILLFMDLTTGKIIRRIDSPLQTGMLAFSPDGRMLAWTSALDSAIRLLEVASGCERRRLLGHRGTITAVAFSADGRRLLSGCADSTALVWDLTVFPPFPPTLGRKEGRGNAAAAGVETLWNDLADEDAARAYRTIHRLADSPSSAIPFMSKRLRPALAVDAAGLVRGITDLDSSDFATRERASAQLATFGEQAVPMYRQALQGRPSLEARRRLEDLLDKAELARWKVSGERLRAVRAIEALEMIGIPEAREVLKTLAAGAAEARQTEEARAALERLVNGRR